MTSKQLVLFGTDASQPCRTVSWLLRMHNVDFEYAMILPGQQTPEGPRFLSKSEWKTVPMIQHGEDFYLSESGAIITYLADYYGWTDVYPKDAKVRAKIQSWLHWHHRNSREFSMAYIGPVLRPDLNLQPEHVAATKKLCAHLAKGLNDTLSTSEFLVGNQPTLADFCVFGDVGQCHQNALDLFDFSPYPNVEKWIQRMFALPQYEETHNMFPMLKKVIHKRIKAKL